MARSITAKATAALLIMLALSACGNTIRGVGHDMANTVDATKNAGQRVGNAVSR